MSAFNIIAIVLVFTATFAVINDRFFKLHRTIGVMLISMIMSLLLLFAQWIGLIHENLLKDMIIHAHFGDTLIEGMLGALLFAGAIHIKSEDFRPRMVPIAVLSVCGVAISTFLVGYILYYTLSFVSSIHLPLVWCFTFAALISPTDPIAVLAILRSIGVSKGLDMDVCGESLFNDGIGLVAFTFFYTLAVNSETMGAAEVTMFFVKNVAGAFVVGFVASYLVYLMMRKVSDYHIEILLTLALVFGTFQLGEWLGISSAIAIVVVGLVFSHLLSKNMSDDSRAPLYTFWEVVDEVLNAVLFVMIGIVLLMVDITFYRLLLGMIAIVIVLFSRWVSVAIPVMAMKRWYYFSPRSVRVLTWGGLRGGLCIAMALTLPDTPGKFAAYKEYILLMTYAVVAFSILVQGMTIAKVAGARSTKGDEYQDPLLNEDAPSDHESLHH